MDYQSLHIKTVAELRQIAKGMKLPLPTGVRKATIIEMILERDQTNTVAEKPAESAPSKPVQTRRKTPAETAPKREERSAETVASKASAPAETAPKREERSAEAVASKASAPAETAPKREERSAETVASKASAPAETAPKREEKSAEVVPIKASAPAETAPKREKSAEAVPIKASAPAETAPKREKSAEAVAQNASNVVETRDAEKAGYRKPTTGYPRMGNRVQTPNGSKTLQKNFAPYASRTPKNPDYRPYGEANDNRRNDNLERRPYGEANDSRRNDNPERRPYGETNDNRRNFSENTRNGADFVPEERGVNTYAAELMASGECGDGAGILEIHADGYGFLRAENYLPGNKDVYVSAAQIRRFNLRNGDYVVGKTRAQMAGDRSVGLIYINEINGRAPEFARRRRPFDSLIPVYPDERLRMEVEGENNVSLRLIDMIAPIGKGQRGMIVSQPKAGKTTLLKNIANSISKNHPEVHLIVLLIDERPEEVTEMKRSIQGEVVYSTFDEAPENHTRVSEMVLERAQRLVELGKDVVILLDSITRLARAYNLVIPPTGRSLSGGLDPGALYKPKRFFGAARNIENGGSLTIIATALVDTGSRMDDIIFEEFKGTGNMELHLDRSLSDRRIFPAIDLFKSGTRREELLLNAQELDAAYQVRRMLARGNAQDAAEQLISMVEKSKCNRDFISMLASWKAANKKDGFN